MRVIETTAYVGADGMLRLEVPLEQRDQDVRVALMVESQPPKVDAEPHSSSAHDPWASYREKLKGSGIQFPAPGSWTPRGSAPLRFEGRSASETLVGDRR